MKSNSYFNQSLYHLSDDALFELFEKVTETVNSLAGNYTMGNVEQLCKEDSDFEDLLALLVELVDIVCIRGLLKN